MIILKIAYDNMTKEYSVKDTKCVVSSKEVSIIFNDGKSLWTLDGKYYYGSDTLVEVDGFYTFSDFIMSCADIIKSPSEGVSIFDVPVLSDSDWERKIEQYEYDEYRNGDGCIGCGENDGPSANGYCAQCWKDRFDCEEDYDY